MKRRTFLALLGLAPAFPATASTTKITPESLAEEAAPILVTDLVIAGHDILVSKAGFTIVFGESFRELDGISIVALDMRDGDYFEITGTSGLGFTIGFRNRHGRRVGPRTFDYIARGRT